MKRNEPLPLDVEPTPEELRRLMAKVSHRKATGCWEWTGHCDDKGYGQFSFRGKSMWAHRVSCAFFRRPLLGGLEIEHKCLNTSCVNPWHLQHETKSVNTANGNRNRNTSEVPF